MRFEREDLLRLRLPLATFAAAALAAALLINYSGEKYTVQQQRVLAADEKVAAASQRYRDSDLEKEMISRYLPQYRDLQQRGFIGSENRINWIDALRVADQQAGGFGVQYQLSAQEPYKGLLSGDPIAPHLRRSTMDIRFNVVHEKQFLAFLNALELQGAGMYTLRACSLEPVHKEQPRPRAENLTAQCEIDWVTLIPPQEEQS
ncbi:MAG: hypothetical protein JSW48_15770 [Betaproteobacteria bacterium]|jgi:hypothetical protein|nr:MAG: hypothetical protein JSW48_15770 [Betaproteobacteria bacterium]